jgi:hypothetical protein
MPKLSDILAGHYVIALIIGSFTYCLLEATVECPIKSRSKNAFAPA